MDDQRIDPLLLHHAGGANEDSTVARVVWYYYVGGMTQQAIAERLGVTRLKVNRIIGQARADGSVRIDVKLPLARCIALEEQLVERFGLQAASVIPSVPDLEDRQAQIGEAAGAMLDPLLTDGVGLGVGWGRTLRAATRRLTPRRLADSYVTSLMGGLTRASGVNTFEVAADYASHLGAECYYFVAPLFCPSEESRSVLLTHHGLSQVMRRARDGTIAMVSSGDLSPLSLLTATQTINDNLESLREAGAVGDLLGVFLDEKGEPVDHPLNHCVMSLAPADLKAYPISILASGGLNKLPIIRAILTAGYVTRLVTDEQVAEALL
ncbi:MAG: sugar-binding transcriptional regulator [Labrys sp. (in: a-proteobacteria)]